MPLRGGSNVTIVQAGEGGGDPAPSVPSFRKIVVSGVGEIEATQPGDTFTIIPGVGQGASVDEKSLTLTPTDQPEILVGVTYINAKTDLGAKGDGSTDDRAALQAGIDALPYSQALYSGAPNGAAIFFPPGAYKLGGELKVYGNITLLSPSANAAILRYSPSTGFAVRISPKAGGEASAASNGIQGVAIKDIGFHCIGETIDGGGLRTGGGGGIAVASGAKILRTTIEDVMFHSVAGTCIDLAAGGIYSQDCIIRDIIAYNPGGQVVRIDGNQNRIENVAVEGGMMQLPGGGTYAGGISLIEARGAGLSIKKCTPETECWNKKTTALFVGASLHSSGTGTSAIVEELWSELYDNVDSTLPAGQQEGYLLHVQNVREGVFFKGGAPLSYGPNPNGRTIHNENSILGIEWLDLRRQSGMTLAQALRMSGTSPFTIIDKLSYSGIPGDLLYDSRIEVLRPYDSATGRMAGLPVPNFTSPPLNAPLGTLITMGGKLQQLTAAGWKALKFE